MKRTLLVACLAFILVAVNADAMSDQFKAYKRLGGKIPHPPALCKLITKSEAARSLGEPVLDGESAGVASGCAYRTVANADTGSSSRAAREATGSRRQNRTITRSCEALASALTPITPTA